MSKTKVLMICVGAIVICLAGVALAKAVKVDLEPYPTAGPIEPGAFGKAVLNYAKGADETQIQINCWGLLAETTYKVYLKPAGWELIGTFTTRRNGTGNFHIALECDRSYDLPVAINNPGNATVLLGP